MKIKDFLKWIYFMLYKFLLILHAVLLLGFELKYKYHYVT